MDAEALRDAWNENKDRPAWVLEHREELAEYITTDEPIPVDGMYGVRLWLARFKATVTRQLNEAAEGGGGSDEPGEGDGMAGDRDIDGEAAEGE